MQKASSQAKSSQPHSARERLITSGSVIFSKKGFGGSSVREICEHAGTSSNMIHHYFGSKRGLYDEILSMFSEQVFTVPLRIINTPPETREILVTRLEIFIEETLQALIENRDLYRLVVQEQVIFSVFEHYSDKFIAFLDAAKANGIVRPALDSAMLTGMILDRLGNQVLYSSWMKKTTGTSILEDAAFRKRWLKANLDLFLNGMLAG